MTLEQAEHLGRPLRADAERNRQRILAAAAEVFARRGLEAGLDEIARHAGVGTGTVYRRFPDKGMLVDALFESRVDIFVDLAHAAADHPDPWAGLVEFIERSVELQIADRALKQLLFGDGCVGGNARFVTKLESIRPLIAGVVENAKASGDLRPDVTVTDLAVMQFMLHGIGVFAEAVQPDLWRRQLAVLLAGLRARPDEPPLPAVPLTLDQLDSLCGPGQRVIALTD